MYDELQRVLNEAHAQASTGKGAERHADGEPFEEQPMLRITRTVGVGFPLGQAIKKAVEARKMLDRGQSEAAKREFLGAIVYLAGAVLYAEEKPDIERALKTGCYNAS